MGNIVGERFDDFVINQINARQSISGKGFGEATLSPSDFLLLNTRNAWLKLASSVNVFNPTVNVKSKNSYEQGFIDAGVIASPTVTLPNGTQRLIDIGIGPGEAPDYLGPKFAQKAVLFNTLSDITNKDKYITRSGVSQTQSLWNNNSYGLGGNEFGLTPAPGLISSKIDSKNRGSIRTAEVVIKAFNQFQFEMIELLYLRLGFTMMLEWGWDKYTTNGVDIKNMGNTIIEEGWFNSSNTSQLDMLNKIQQKRREYAGNYDGFFGKVVNFDWNFNKNGSYDITLNLVTLGDVIESIKSKPHSSPLTVTNLKKLISLEEDSSEKERLESIKDSTIVNMAGSNPISHGLYADIIEPSFWDKKDKDYFTFNNITYFGITPPGTNSAGRNIIEELVGNITGDGRSTNPRKKSDEFSYYMTFSEFLNRVQLYSIPFLGPNKEKAQKQLSIDIDIESNLCSAYPNQISFDPKICLIRPTITNSMIKGPSAKVENLDWWDNLKEFAVLENPNLLYGKVMNIYLNYKFISDCLSQNMDKDGNISIYKLITRICDGINSALGNLQQIEAVVRDEINITIQDQNPIPGLELKFPDVATTNITPFEVFGFNTVGSGSSNFVTDFSFNTKITPQLASSISIGTTANNISTKNYDGTAFSKWNSGLQDRYAAFYSDPLPKIESPSSGKLTPKQIEQEIKAWNDNIGPLGIPYPDNPTRKSFIKSPTTRKTYGTWVSITLSKYLQEVKDEYQLQFEKNKKIEGEERINKLYKNDYGYYLTRAFGGNPVVEGTDNSREIFPYKAQYYLMEEGFIEEGKSLFNNYIISNNLNPYYNVTNTPGNTIGYIPADLGLTFKGLSGIKIYQQLAVRQDFLPIQYSKALKFLIKGVNHSISNNDWSTNLSTLSIPNVEATLNIDNESTPNTSDLDSGLDGSNFIDDSVLTGPVPPDEFPIEIPSQPSEPFSEFSPTLPPNPL